MSPNSSFLSAFLLLLFAASSFSSALDTSELFENWCNQYGKTYSSKDEKLHRFRVFQDNYDFVARHNQMPNSTYSLSLNGFADLTHHEFKASRLGLSPALLRFDHRPHQESDDPLDIPSEVDWRKQGAVTNVKDQASCGLLLYSILWSFL